MGVLSIQQAYELAKQHFASGQLPEAESIARQILAIQPNHADTIHLLGLISLRAGRAAPAVDLIRGAIANYSQMPAGSAESDLAECHGNLGIALAQLGQVDDAIAAQRQSLIFRPNSPASYNNLGNALQMKGDIEAAADAFRRALSMLPGDADASSNLGNLFHAKGELDAALAVFREGLAHHPNHPSLHWNLALLLLLRGEYQKGWEESEWRLRLPELKPLFPTFVQPRWDGSDLNGRRILLHAEQGFGDSIHFGRYIPLVAQRGGKMIVAAQPRLQRLLRSIPEIDEFVASNQPLPPFDVHCPLLSLPFALGSNSPCWTKPYLHADTALAGKFTDVLQTPGKLKVGLVWAGRAQPAGRSIPLAMLAPLAHPKIQFYSLQVGAGSEEAKHPPAEMNLIDATNRIADFADTAALISGMDLIISIDTATAQLAGAMGKRTWTFLKFVPDWRWGMKGNDSPWYPTMKLFRQEHDGDWTSPVQQVAQLLHREIAGETDDARTLAIEGYNLQQKGRLNEAIIEYRKALSINPNQASAAYNLGHALQSANRPEEAIAAYREALVIDPDGLDAWNNMGTCYKEMGYLDQALTCYEKELENHPENVLAHSNRIYSIYFHPDFDAARIATEEAKWNRRHAEPLRAEILPHQNDRNPNRRLRVGYVSPHFRRHAESFFTIPLLSRHDHQRFEIFCYSDVLRGDVLTEKFRQYSDGWRDTTHLNDARLAEMIRTDEIDILIDLTMHMSGSRLLAFARKPAPLQVTWLAYPGGTGLRTMDYRLTDRWMDPSENPFYAERSIHLPDCWVCYDPLEDIAAELIRKNGPVCFGSLNNPCKLNKGVIDLWSGVLNALPESRLMLQAIAQNQREQIVRWFSEQGVNESRIEFVGRMSRNEYLKTYHRIDIGLDPFPYNGITTTCDALHMGVPVISLAGSRAASRAGLGILSTIGLGDLVTHSREEFVKITAMLANDSARLAHLRATLRQQLADSPLRDAKRFTQNVEIVYRDIWKSWCAKQP